MGEAAKIKSNEAVFGLATSGVRKLEVSTFGSGGDLNMDFNLNMDFVLELAISGVRKLELATFGGWEELAMKLILGLAIPGLVGL